jgi:hypothetical protein
MEYMPIAETSSLYVCSGEDNEAPKRGSCEFNAMMNGVPKMYLNE